MEYPGKNQGSDYQANGKGEHLFWRVDPLRRERSLTGSPHQFVDIAIQIIGESIAAPAAKQYCNEYADEGPRSRMSLCCYNCCAQTDKCKQYRFSGFQDINVIPENSDRSRFLFSGIGQGAQNRASETKKLGEFESDSMIPDGCGAVKNRCPLPKVLV